MSNAMMLTKRGTTSWGQPWCATFGRAVVLMNNDRLLQAVFIMDKGKDPEYIETEVVDPSLTLTQEQLTEMLCIARGMKKWCKEMTVKVKNEAVPTALLYLIAYYKKGILKDPDEFFKSNEYRTVVAATIQAVRATLNATFKSDDYIFTQWIDKQTNTPGEGALYEEITNLIKCMAKYMCKEEYNEH